MKPDPVLGWKYLKGHYRYNLDGRLRSSSAMVEFFDDAGLEYIDGDLRAFQANVLRLDSFLISQLRTNDFRIRWTRTRPAAQNRYMMIFVSKGEIAAVCQRRRCDIDGRRIIIEPGVDPVDLISAEHSEAILFTFDGTELGTRAPDPRVMREMVWESPLTRALFSCLKVILDQASQSTGSDSVALRGLVRDVARCIVTVASPIVSSDVFERAQDMIRREFSDPTLSADRIAERLGVSRRTLVRHYSSRQRAITHEIRRARADFAIARLERIHTLHLTVLASHSGFGSVDSLKRALHEFHPERWERARNGQNLLVP